ncbi:hypothetical protein F4604DRAFT_1676764 [Suillus subluteus]|nr:hypothetical protein F4604DRAFT_1676764 [Suillus subluteus]
MCENHVCVSDKFDNRLLGVPAQIRGPKIGMLCCEETKFYMQYQVHFYIPYMKTWAYHEFIQTPDSGNPPMDVIYAVRINARGYKFSPGSTKCCSPTNTFGFGIYEPRAQEFLPQHITYSEEQKSVNTLNAYHVRPELLPDPNSGLTSYELEAQDFLSQYVIYSEGQTWPALRNPRVTATLPEEADSYLCQPPQDLLPYGTKSTDHVPGARGIVPLHSSSAEEQTWPGSSSRHDQSPPPPMVQGRQNTVMCTQPGCRRFLKKENLTHHINEILTVLLEGWKGWISECQHSFLRGHSNVLTILNLCCGSHLPGNGCRVREWIGSIQTTSSFTLDSIHSFEGGWAIHG